MTTVGIISIISVTVAIICIIIACVSISRERSLLKAYDLVVTDYWEHAALRDKLLEAIRQVYHEAPTTFKAAQCWDQVNRLSGNTVTGRLRMCNFKEGEAECGG